MKYVADDEFRQQWFTFLCPHSRNIKTKSFWNSAKQVFILDMQVTLPQRCRQCCAFYCLAFSIIWSVHANCIPKGSCGEVHANHTIMVNLLCLCCSHTSSQHTSQHVNTAGLFCYPFVNICYSVASCMWQYKDCSNTFTYLFACCSGQ